MANGLARRLEHAEDAVLVYGLASDIVDSLRRGALALLVVFATACTYPRSPSSVVSTSGEERALAPRALRVVSHDEGVRSGLRAQPISLAFGVGKDGTALVSELLQDAERRGAELVSDITIVLSSSGAEGNVECLTEVVPESVTETRWTPGSHRMVPVQAPVSRLVTEQRYRCRSVTRPETRYVTEYERRCRMVSKPVTRTRTTYSYQYDYSSKRSRSVPRTERYTTYESRQECDSHPVRRSRTQYVPKQECGFEPITHYVTRYEFQLQSQYIPPRLETFERHRLKELEPKCYAADVAPGQASNRIQAVLYFRG